MRLWDPHDPVLETRAHPEENDWVAEPLIAYWLALEEDVDPSAPRRGRADRGWLRLGLTRSLQRLARFGLSDVFSRQRRFNGRVRDAFAQTVVELSALQRRLDLLERDHGLEAPPIRTAS